MSKTEAIAVKPAEELTDHVEITKVQFNHISRNTEHPVHKYVKQHAVRMLDGSFKHFYYIKI